MRIANSIKSLSVIATNPLNLAVTFPFENVILRAKDRSVEEALCLLDQILDRENPCFKKLYFNHFDTLKIEEALRSRVRGGGACLYGVGIHLEKRLLNSPEMERPMWLSLLESGGYGTSLHSVEETDLLVKFVERTQVAPDYVLISNVFETACKVGKMPILQGEFRTMVGMVRNHTPMSKTKILLLGGVDENNVGQLNLNGYDYDGVAVMSLADSPDRLKRLNDVLKLSVI